MKRLSEVSSRLRLDPEHKQHIREQLHTFMRQHDVSKQTSERYLERREMVNPLSALFAPFLNQLTIRHMAIALIVAVLIASGGGVSLAAEQAQPGDTLYSVKTNINEEVRGLFTLDAEARAEWEARLAERRLVEAEKIAADGELQGKQQAQLAARFEQHLDKAQSRIEKLRDKGNTVAAANASARLESSLMAHIEVLNALTAANIISTSESADLMANIQARLDTVTAVRSQLTADVSAQTDTNLSLAADAKRVDAERRIAAVRRLFGRTDAMSAQAQASAEGRLQMAEQAIINGNADLQASTAAQAFTNYDRAERIAREVEVLVQTARHLNVQLDVDESVAAQAEATSAAAAVAPATESNKANSGVNTTVKKSADAAARATTTQNTVHFRFRSVDSTTDDQKPKSENNSADNGSNNANTTTDTKVDADTNNSATTETNATIDVDLDKINNTIDATTNGSVDVKVGL